MGPSDRRETPAQRLAKARSKGLARVRAAGLAATDAALLFVCLWLETFGSPGTTRNYSDAIAIFFAWCAERSTTPFELSPLHAKAYITDQTVRPTRAGNAPSQKTVNVRIGVARSFMEQAKAAQLISYNPFLRLKGPRNRPTLPTPAISEAEVNEMLARLHHRAWQPKGGVIEARDYALVYTGVRIGLRSGEYGQLTFGGLIRRSEHWELSVSGKGKIASTNLPDDLYEVLRSWKAVLEAALRRPLTASDAIFPALGAGACVLRQRGAAPLVGLSAQGANVLIVKALRGVGLTGPGMASHCLRATSATIAYRNGADRLAIRDQMRHESTTMTDAYIRSDDGTSAAAVWRPTSAPTLPIGRRRGRPLRVADGPLPPAAF